MVEAKKLIFLHINSDNILFLALWLATNKILPKIFDFQSICINLMYSNILIPKRVKHLLKPSVALASRRQTMTCCFILYLFDET